MSKKKYRIDKTTNIGAPDAETDEILFNVFVENDTLKEVIDIKNQKSILLGRTGSGKSAVIKYIEQNNELVKRIDPEAMALQFLSNSTILKYFKELNINLNLFFKVLWKHVFIVELLKLYLKEDININKEKKELWLSKLKEGLLNKKGKPDPQKQKALDYLDNWTDKFWHDTEYRIKELVKSISESFGAAIGVSGKIIDSKLDLEEKINNQSITEVKHKAESIIHQIQSKELLGIIEMMKNGLFTDYQKKVYIVIDDLDKEWIETNFRYDLIGAMVEVIKDFRQFKGVKVVISLRENLSELLKLGSKHEGGQREKFKPLYASMKWSEDDLVELINRRLKSISNNQLDVDSFYKIRRTGQTGIQHVLERTFMRPRDIISYINHAIENSNNKPEFTKDILFKAEIPYSTDRFHALEDEWRENYGEIYPVCIFLNGIHLGFKLKAIKEDYFADIYCDDNEKRFKGVLLDTINDWKNDSIKFTVFSKKIIFLLYHIGIIGVKKGPNFQIAFFYDDISITKDDISNNNRYYVHPSLYSHFKVNTLEQLPED